jgi:hypothetical protein
MAVKVPEVSEEAQWLSDRLSVQVRWVAVGILAFVWGLIISPPRELAISQRLVLWAGLLAIAALLVDLLQYVVGYVYTVRILRRMERGIDASYNRRHLLYRLRHYCFVAKQIIALGAGVMLASAVLPPLLAG